VNYGNTSCRGYATEIMLLFCIRVECVEQLNLHTSKQQINVLFLCSREAISAIEIFGMKFNFA